MKYATAGTLESNDCLITVYENESLDIVIESIVKDVFGDQILAVVEEVLQPLKIKKVKVLVQDNGALDYTIRARLKTALKRWEDIQ